MFFDVAERFVFLQMASDPQHTPIFHQLSLHQTLTLSALSFTTIYPHKCKKQSENRGCGSLPVIVGRSLPRAIADAKSAGVAAGNRAPPFESQTAGGGRGGSSNSNSKKVKHANFETRKTEGDGRGKVSTEDMIAGNPRRAMEEVSLRAKLEVLRGEVDATLKMHATMARGERTSWLKQIERQNEENAYEVKINALPLVVFLLKIVRLYYGWAVCCYCE